MIMQSMLYEAKGPPNAIDSFKEIYSKKVKKSRRPIINDDCA